PSLLPGFLTCYAERAPCLVKARRRCRRAPLREIGSFLYNIEARLLFGVRCGDVNGTPKVFSAAFYRSLRLTANGDLFDLELLRGAARRGLPVIEVTTFGFTRHGGRSSTTWCSAWRMYFGALGLWLREPA